LSASDPPPTTHDVDPGSGEPSPPDHARIIGRQAGRGLRWALAGTVVTKLGSFAMSLVLARLLVPEDFGIFAIALAATQFAMHVNDMGIIAATCQWRGRVADMVPTGTTMALLFSVGWYALFWLGAPWFASLAGSPDATPVVRLLTVVILIDGVTAVRVGLLQRRFQQDKLALAIMAGFLVNAPVAIVLAARGAGAYSFVVGQLCQAVVTAVMVLVVVHMPFRLGMDRVVARQLLKFGAPLAAGLAAESALLYSDSVIVGHLLGPVLLGYYILAFNVSSWIPGLLSTAVRYVSIPGFSRLAEHGEEPLSRGARKAITITALVATPVGVGLATLAPALVASLYGESWLPSSGPLRFLAVVMFARMFTTLALDLQTSLGNTKVPMLVNTAWVIALVPALLLGTRWGGITGAAAASAVVAVVVAIPLIVASLHRAGVDLRPALRDLGRIVLGAAAAAVVMLGVARLSGGNPTVQLLVGGAAGVCAYVLVVVPAQDRARYITALRRRLRPVPPA
jgi:O-antigen/teichoic acid export membrane protein